MYEPSVALVVHALAISDKPITIKDIAKSVYIDTTSENLNAIKDILHYELIPIAVKTVAGSQASTNPQLRKRKYYLRPSKFE